ncbi:MAG: M20/M25/M40 family metallo-hydrolase [Anaerolineae bacterium]|nr:M20/M25/M40 family metallo-hydrolase [Anaerolineae bacterium]
MPTVQPQNSIEAQLLAYIAEHADETTEFCQEMMRTPSVNGVDDERAVAELIADFAGSKGLLTEVAGSSEARPNVIAHTHPDGETGLLLIGHLDTVAAGDKSAWTYPPFSATLADGKLFGRGAVDTKGGMAAAIMALAALKAIPGALVQGRASFIGVPDEESGATGTLGIRWLAAREKLKGKGAIYCYSGRDIHLGHRGLIRFEITCKGESVHTGSDEWQNGQKGTNAVIAMARLLLKLEEAQFLAGDGYFSRFKTVVTPGTMINGGIGVSIVPDRCAALVDVRTVPGADQDVLDFVARAVAEVQAAHPGLKVDVNKFIHLSAAISDENAPIFSIVEDVTEQLTGLRPRRLVAGPANEGYLLIEHGIPTICGFGPIGDNFHAIDEYVEVNSLVETAQIYALTAHRMSAYAT